MQKKEKNGVKDFFTKHNKLLALIGIALFILLTATAITTYPQYDFFNQHLSDLGVGSTALFFNLGIILCGLMLIPFFVSHYKKNSFLMQLISILGTVSMLFFTCIAIFPLTTLTTHLFVTSMFFFTISATIFFALAEMLRENFKKLKLRLFSIFLFVLVSIFTAAIIWSYILIQTPAWQKLAVMCIIIWAVEWIIVKKN